MFPASCHVSSTGNGRSQVSRAPLPGYFQQYSPYLIPSVPTAVGLGILEAIPLPSPSEYSSFDLVSQICLGLFQACWCSHIHDFLWQQFTIICTQGQLPPLFPTQFSMCLVYSFTCLCVVLDTWKTPAALWTQSYHCSLLFPATSYILNKTGSRTNLQDSPLLTLPHPLPFCNQLSLHEITPGSHNSFIF